MSTSDGPFGKEAFEQFKDLCFHIGLAMVTWQDVEDEHFKLFFKTLGASRYNIGSVVYYSTESFEARHRMVNGWQYGPPFSR